MRNNLRYQLAFVLGAIGGGLCVYGALKWHQLPQYSEHEIAVSTDLNLSLDLYRLGTNPPPEKIEDMRRAVRTEIETDIARERKGARDWFFGGLVLLAMSFAQALLQRYLAGKGRN